MTFDWIFVGGGLANGFAAYRLLNQNPSLSVLVLEQSDVLGGSHTWSFHRGDVSRASLEWLRPFVVAQWDLHEVLFPGRRRILNSRYLSIRSERFHEVLSPRLGERVRYGEKVIRIEPDGVMLADGTWLKARGVIDGRGFGQLAAEKIRYQNFFGQDVAVAGGHGMSHPVLMDACCEQKDGFRFFYLLPWDENKVLIEDTRYCDSAKLDPEDAKREIAAYAARRGWTVTEVLREESGSLPIPLERDFQMSEIFAGATRLGVKAGLFHPTTGYSLPDAVKTADLLAHWSHLPPQTVARFIASYAQKTERRRGFYRYLNRMLFLGGPKNQRFKLLERFYGLSESVVEHFYAAELTTRDRLRLLAGKPPISVVRALRLLLSIEGTSYAR